MNIKSNSGFSLVELMVVVAIIGVLATVAVPNYMKFQAKAKQSNAKAELSGIYTAEKAFYVEYTQYNSHLPLIGFVPEGQTQCVAPPITTNRVYNTGIAIISPVAPIGAIFPCGGTAVANGTQYFGCAGQGCNGMLPSPPGPAHIDLTINIFVAAASATLRAPALDLWTINNEKALINQSLGI